MRSPLDLVLDGAQLLPDPPLLPVTRRVRRQEEDPEAMIVRRRTQWHSWQDIAALDVPTSGHGTCEKGP